MIATRFRGLIAAPFTPLHADQSLNLGVIPSYARLLRKNGVSAAFVCGTTGEGLALNQAERKVVAEAWMACADERFRIIVHVGHNVLSDAQELAQHAATIGAAAIGSSASCFFKPRTHHELVGWCKALAGAAPTVPFYYYNIPSMTGVGLPVAPFLELAEGRIPSLAGVKYTHDDLPDFEACRNVSHGKYDILFGRDELLLEALERGAVGAVGSTYNYAAPVYRRIIEHAETRKSAEARMLQDQAIAMIQLCAGTGVTHQAATKAMMAWQGVDCGPTRLPVSSISPGQLEELRTKLETIGYFDFAGVPL